MEGCKGDLNGFIVDEMLWKLGRFLRIAGYVVEIPRPTDDNELVRSAAEKGHILLTRDRDLSRRKGARSLLIESDELKEQLGELKRAGCLSAAERNGSRCPVCGGELLTIRKGSEGWKRIEEQVPPGTRRVCDMYYECTICGKVYWKGSHWKRIEDILAPFDISPDIE